MQYEGDNCLPSIVPISCIFVRNTIHVFLLLEMCFRDVTTFRMTYTRGGSKKEITVTLAYLPYDSEPSGSQTPRRGLALGVKPGARTM